MRVIELLDWHAWHQKNWRRSYWPELCRLVHSFLCVFVLVCIRCYAVTRLLAGILYTTFTRSCMYSLLRCYEVTGRNSVHLYFHAFLCVFAVTVLRCYEVTLLRCYEVTLLRCYEVTLLRCYEVTSRNSVHHFHSFQGVFAVTLLRCYEVTLLRSYAVTLLRSYAVTLLRSYWRESCTLLSRVSGCIRCYAVTLLCC